MEWLRLAGIVVCFWCAYTMVDFWSDLEWHERLRLVKAVLLFIAMVCLRVLERSFGPVA